MERRYVTTRDAARYLGVCDKTFRKMVSALPASRRPKAKQWPGVTAKRWDVQELDSAFNAASKSAGWDRKLARHHEGQGVG